jgi:hypothetical protein
VPRARRRPGCTCGHASSVGPANSLSAVRVRGWRAVVKNVGVRPPNDGQAAADDARPRPPENASYPSGGARRACRSPAPRARSAPPSAATSPSPSKHAGENAASPRISAGLPPTLGFGACQSSSWARRRVVARGGGPSMADAGAFGTGAGEADYAESTDKLENFFNSFEDEDIHGQVGRSVRLGSGSEPGQGRGSGLGIGSRWCVRSWPRHTQCTR